MAGKGSEKTWYEPHGTQALSRHPIAVKVSKETEDLIKRLPTPYRGQWLRRVISEAAEKELVNFPMDTPGNPDEAA